MFKFVDREKKDHLVIIPGWAFDYRIFASLDLPYNYFFFCDESMAGFEGELRKLLAENNIEKIVLPQFYRFVIISEGITESLNINAIILVGSCLDSYPNILVTGFKKS